MTMLMTNACVCIILLVCLYMSAITVSILILSVFTVEYVVRIRKLVMWMFFVSVIVLITVCAIMSSTYCT